MQPGKGSAPDDDSATKAPGNCEQRESRVSSRANAPEMAIERRHEKATPKKIRSEVVRAQMMAGFAALVVTAACSGGAAPPVRDASQPAASPSPPRSKGCAGVPSSADLQKWLREAPAQNGDAGGLNHGKAMWGAGVDRNAQLGPLGVAKGDRAVARPGSRGIAIAKASTSNAFSPDTAPMSTARLYTLSQPGHSLWGAANGNPFNSLCAGAANDASTGIGKVCGGTIAFGGGLALFKGQTRVGGLGVRGGTH